MSSPAQLRTGGDASRVPDVARDAGRNRLPALALPRSGSRVCGSDPHSQRCSAPLWCLLLSFATLALMDTPKLIAVTGATGALGGRVAARLAAAGVRQRLVVRDPSRAPDLPNVEIAQATYDDAGRAAGGLRGHRRGVPRLGRRASGAGPPAPDGGRRRGRGRGRAGRLHLVRQRLGRRDLHPRAPPLVDRGAAARARSRLHRVARQHVPGLPAVHGRGRGRHPRAGGRRPGRDGGPRRHRRCRCRRAADGGPRAGDVRRHGGPAADAWPSGRPSCPRSPADR